MEGGRGVEEDDEEGIRLIDFIHVKERSPMNRPPNFWTPHLRQLFKPGQKVKVFFSKGNINNQTIHIRAIVDDDFVVYRYWKKSKQYWDYGVTYIYYYNILDRDGYIRKG